MTRSVRKSHSIPAPTATQAARGADTGGRPANAPPDAPSPSDGGDLREPSVAELLRAIERPDEDAIAFDAFTELRAIAADVIEDILRAFAANRGNIVVRRRLGELLANARVRDERIRLALLNLLVEDPVAGAAWLAEYGDRTVIPHLLRAFDKTRLDAAASRASARDDSGEPHEDAYAIASAVSFLGGALSSAQRAKLEEAIRRRDDAFAALLATKPPPVLRLGERQSRNSHCRCRSGKKYKKCHLTLDVAASR